MYDYLEENLVSIVCPCETNIILVGMYIHNIMYFADYLCGIILILAKGYIYTNHNYRLL